jgi:protein gp37
MTNNLSLVSIRRDGGTQARAALNAETVAEYAEAMGDGADFPPVIVFFDGAEYWLADGFHRAEAAQSLGLADIAATVRQGTRRDAVLYAVGANHAHGLKRTNADKRRAVETLLHDPEWARWSDREIARRASVSNRFVTTMRAELSVNRSQIDQPARLVERNGTTYDMRMRLETVERVASSPLPETPLQVSQVILKPERPLPLHDYITLSDWQQMTQAERTKALARSSSAAAFNRQDDTSDDSMGNIEWARWSWNPVTGCKHDCPYCYARDIAERFYPQGFEPSFWPGRLSAPKNTRQASDADMAARNVFSNSMSDLYGRWVPDEWIDATLSAMRDAPQWNFLMLTKFPKKAAEFTYSHNCWIGTSVDLQVRVKAAEDAFERIECGVRWLSIEPMLEPLTFTRPKLFNWVVIGGASRSTKTPAWTPPFEWVVRTASQFLEHGSRVYLKTNGRPREYPGLITPERADEVFYYLGKKG